LLIANGCRLFLREGIALRQFLRPHFELPLRQPAPGKGQAEDGLQIFGQPRKFIMSRLPDNRLPPALTQNDFPSYARETILVYF
jgi:hypothetical protein